LADLIQIIPTDTPAGSTATISKLSVGTHYYASPRGCEDGKRLKIRVNTDEADEAKVLFDPAARFDRNARWQQVIADESSRLEDEAAEHGDLLILPGHLDSYRSLPGKLLAFYRWASTLRFRYTLKTDDDVFVNIARVAAAVKDLGQRKSTWWSQFREGWPVARTGKWAEPAYRAPNYPAFGCGVGNVLSEDLVRWLSANSDLLQWYQGEDVSVGIWLSPLHPDLIHADGWSCFKGCREAMLASPENSPAELRSMWGNLTACGSPCGCS
jgi:hypothetical protein